MEVEARLKAGTVADIVKRKDEISFQHSLISPLREERVDTSK
jgi:hypothetical protein